MATIQIKRRTSVGIGPLKGNTGTVKAGEPLVDFAEGYLYIAKADKTASFENPLAETDYMNIPSTDKVDNQIDNKITALGLGTASKKNTGTTSGCVPVLDTNGKLVDSVIPKVALTNTFVVANEAAMLALTTAQEGDVAVRTDLSKTFILKTTGYATLANWQELLTPTDTVQSVNGKTGAVTVTLSDLNGVSNSTFSTHATSDIHLTANQKLVLANVKNTDLDLTSEGIEYVDDLGQFEARALQSGLLIYQELIAGNPSINNYFIGIDKDKVLLPSSVIDGGTY